MPSCVLIRATDHGTAQPIPILASIGFSGTPITRVWLSLGYGLYLPPRDVYAAQPIAEASVCLAVCTPNALRTLKYKHL